MRPRTPRPRIQPSVPKTAIRMSAERSPKIRSPCPDVEELNNGGHVCVEDEPAGALGDRVPLLLSVRTHVVRKHTRHVEELLRVSVRKLPVGVRECHGSGATGRDVEVEQE